MKFISRNARLFLTLVTISFGILTSCDKNDSTPEPASPNAPALNAPTEILTTGFKVSWTAIAGADKYLIDVSLKDDFSTTVTGYNKKEVTGTSVTITGLTSNTKYYIRGYSKSGNLTSVASTIKNATTAPETPVVNAATEITATSFKANWTAVTVADKYLLDVSVKDDFSTTITGYNKKEVTGNSQTITGLTAATKYYYRVFTKKGELASPASATKDVTTSAK